MKMHLNDKFGEIENNIRELNEKVVMVSRNDIPRLQEAQIPFYSWSEKGDGIDKFIVARGKKPKKFSDYQVICIRNEYNAGTISIRRLADKYKCSKGTIQKILKDTY